MTRPPGDTELLDVHPSKLPWPQRIAASRHGMVATAHSRATEAAVEILAEGGNAIDAAVGAALALGVCEPAASGLGLFFKKVKTFQLVLNSQLFAFSLQVK